MYVRPENLLTHQFEDLDPRYFIIIKGARQHNLKNVDVAIPRNRLVVVTGVSGSGKSTLTIDTLYAEGQRRYVESLSSYARQFLTRMNKPDVDYIKGISPAIAVEQKVVTRTSRSTVGTLTEIYDYLRLLYARIGRTYSPISGEPVRKDEVSDVTDYIFSLPAGTLVQMFIPLHLHSQAKDGVKKEFDLLLRKGFTRIQYGGQLLNIEDTDPEQIEINMPDLKILIDRLVVKPDDYDIQTRAADSVNIAFFEGHGECILITGNGETKRFSNRFERDGLSFDEPNAHFFNFNSPYGACPVCEGFGQVIGVDENRVFPDKNLSVYEGAIAPWHGEKMKAWKDELILHSHKFDFPIHRAIADLTPQEYQLLWTGNEYFEGLDQFFRFLEEQSFKIHYRIMMAKYRGRTVCRNCQGSRLRPDAQYIKIGGKAITGLVNLPIKEVKAFFEQLELNDHDKVVSSRILMEINNRLKVMTEIGLGYLTLNRVSATLSGGETQRINLTRSLGSNLTNSMYILDEPSIGLHSKDTEKLIEVLKQLRNLGNTVIIVEHDEEIMRAADYLIDMGPLAGHLGGEVIFDGAPKELPNYPESLTAQYLLGTKTVSLPGKKRVPNRFIVIEQARQHNLKNITARFPLQAITVVTGVSGSGKTTLIKNILYPALKLTLKEPADIPGIFGKLSGELSEISRIELIDQNPLGKSSRSNPITYIKAYDSIRDLFAHLPMSKARGFQPKHFSFNVEGGRCESCQGDGETVVEMQFLADVHLTCEDCNGKRFKQEVLDVEYKGKSVYDVLEMSVDEALIFFGDLKDISGKLKPLADVGLGYVKLGQSSSTLSGGEAQRVKLASFLSKGRSQTPILFIFDEPSTGLHFNDINKLLQSFNSLVENGHTIVVVEHNLDIVKCADWVIDLGPDGGDEGGYLLFEGPPEELQHCAKSYTAKYLKVKYEMEGGGGSV
ncbi:MAG: excinuclease ABC subunit UvrA [Sphingobacteriales bacterium]|nr:MAG: excinuclease ABC subunit UvrA [Sphingobacteriales bacterium]